MKIFSIVFIALLVWANNNRHDVIVEPTVEILTVVDPICGNLVETNTNWSGRLFTERDTHYFCSEECFAEYVKLTYD
jgi:YHS domain-containing protein